MGKDKISHHRRHHQQQQYEQPFSMLFHSKSLYYHHYYNKVYVTSILLASISFLTKKHFIIIITNLWMHGSSNCLTNLRLPYVLDSHTNMTIKKLLTQTFVVFLHQADFSKLSFCLFCPVSQVCCSQLDKPVPAPTAAFLLCPAVLFAVHQPEK